MIWCVYDLVGRIMNHREKRKKTIRIEKKSVCIDYITSIPVYASDVIYERVRTTWFIVDYRLDNSSISSHICQSQESNTYNIHHVYVCGVWVYVISTAKKITISALWMFDTQNNIGSENWCARQSLCQSIYLDIHIRKIGPIQKYAFVFSTK